jgi:ribonucleoside-triphosphate reductase
MNVMHGNSKLEKINEQIKQINEAMASPHLAEGTSSTYSRISGYYRSVPNWNEGKKAEFNERKEYNLS